MKKIFLIEFVCLSAVLTIFMCFFYTFSFASDDFYGDDSGKTAFASIAKSLSSPYCDCEFITVSGTSGVKKYYFNVEMYLEKGYLVYGDPCSVSDCGYVNTFKVKNGGYFSAGGVSDTRGEYRYLGFSIDGAPQTNKNFPDDINTSINGFVIVPYTSLPAYLKERYAVPSSGNSVFESVRELIDAPGSPVFNFTKSGDGMTLRDFIFAHGGTSGFSVFSNAIIYSWGNGEGSVRIFLNNPKDRDDYRYATFTGKISPEWQKIFSEITCALHTEKGALSFTMKPSDRRLTIKYYVTSWLRDSYSSISEYDRQFYFTRDDIKSYKLYFNGIETSVDSYDYAPSALGVYGSLSPVTYNRSALNLGENKFIYYGKATVFFENVSYTAQNTIPITINVKDPPPTITPTPTPKPTATSAATPTPKPTATPAATPTPKPTATPAATPTPKPTATSAATPTPKPTATSEPSASPTPYEDDHKLKLKRRW